MMRIAVERMFSQGKPVAGWATYEPTGQSTISIAGTSDEINSLVREIWDLLAAKGVEVTMSGNDVVTRPPQWVRCEHGTIWEYRGGGYCSPGSVSPSYYTVADLAAGHGPITVVAAPGGGAGQISAGQEP